MIGERIKMLRNACKMNQKDVADKIGVSKSTIAMWETDKREPNIEMLQKLSECFGVSIDFLVDNEGKFSKEESALSLYIGLDSDGQHKADEFMQFLMTKGKDTSNN